MTTTFAHGFTPNREDRKRANAVAAALRPRWDTVQRHSRILRCALGATILALAASWASMGPHRATTTMQTRMNIGITRWFWTLGCCGTLGWFGTALLSPVRADADDFCARIHNDDRLRPYDPAMRPDFVHAFRKLFPDAKGGQSDAMLRAEAFFRCMDGKLVACFTGANLPCGKINRSRENPGAEAFCRGNRDARARCRGSRPAMGWNSPTGATRAAPSFREMPGRWMDVVSRRTSGRHSMWISGHPGGPDLLKHRHSPKANPESVSVPDRRRAEVRNRRH